MNKKRILIITPPLVSPALPSFTGAFAAGCLSCADVNVTAYDAGLDFFVNHVFSKRRIESHFEMAAGKKEQGVISADNFMLLEKIFQRVSSQSFSLDFFKAASFYDPEKYLVARNRLDDLFLLYSYAYYPSRIRWNPRSCYFNHDILSSMLIPFWGEKLDPRLKKVRPDVILLALDSETQILSANSIIQYVKPAFPEIRIVILQNSRQATGNTPYADHFFSLQDPDLFFQWINTTWKLQKQYTDIEPDFSIFPLKDYLAPEVILAVQPSSFKDSSSFRDILSVLKDKYNAKGFFLENLPASFEILSIMGKQPDFSGGIRAAMEDPDRVYSVNKRQQLCSSGVILAQWEAPEKKEALNTRLLWDFSRQGIWNHVELTDRTQNTVKNDLLRFISANPNIVHSHDNTLRTGSYNQVDLTGIDSSLQAYAKVTPLPGEPFWKLLSDPVHLLLYLKHQGKKNLFCLRADRIKENLMTLGKGIQFYFKKPADLPSDLLDEICAMVEAGGSVDTKFVRYNLGRAYLIGYALENGILIGNSSLKHPRKEFIRRLNTITGLEFNDFVERGYTSVRPEYRALGVGAGLLKGLTKRVGHYKIFSIISEDNTATHKIAIKNKTKKIAVYYSEKVEKELGVWMPVHMIEEDWNLKL